MNGINIDKWRKLNLGLFQAYIDLYSKLSKNSNLDPGEVMMESFEKHTTLGKLVPGAYKTAYTISRELGIYYEDDDGKYHLSRTAELYNLGKINYTDYLKTYCLNINFVINDIIVQPLNEIIEALLSTSKDIHSLAKNVPNLVPSNSSRSVIDSLRQFCERCVEAKLLINKKGQYSLAMNYHLIKGSINHGAWKVDEFKELFIGGGAKKHRNMVIQLLSRQINNLVSAELSSPKEEGLNDDAQNQLFNEVKNDFQIESFENHCVKAGLEYNSQLIQRFIASLLTKPFVLLSGLSGSGKTKLAEAFVMWICQDKSQYKLVPVGADWTNREPLLGFPNALDAGEYVHPDNGVLQLVMNAQANQDRPYFLILDEMNLSHVERYFADFLSTMESSEAEIQLHDNDKIKNNPENPIPKKLNLPKNLFIIGTVNIDETTYMFSPKVLDRANTIEFRVTKDEIEGFFKAPKDIDLDIIKAKGASMAASFLKKSLSKEITASQDAKDELVSFFEDLQKTGAEFGYRTANEMVKLITNLEKLGVDNEDESIDIAIMQKMLPKLNGSRRKLSKVLISLGTKCLKDKSVNVETEYFAKEEADLSDVTKVKYPLSFEKITRMYRNARDNGFASYAEA